MPAGHDRWVNSTCNRTLGVRRAEVTCAKRLGEHELRATGSTMCVGPDQMCLDVPWPAAGVSVASCVTGNTFGFVVQTAPDLVLFRYNVSIPALAVATTGFLGLHIILTKTSGTGMVYNAPMMAITPMQMTGGDASRTIRCWDCNILTLDNPPLPSDFVVEGVLQSPQDPVRLRGFLFQYD